MSIKEAMSRADGEDCNHPRIHSAEKERWGQEKRFSPSFFFPFFFFSFSLSLFPLKISLSSSWFSWAEWSTIAALTRRGGGRGGGECPLHTKRILKNPEIIAMKLEELWNDFHRILKNIQKMSLKKKKKS